VAEAFMPTAGSQRVLEQETSIKMGLPPADRAALEQAEVLKQKGVSQLSQDERALVDEAQKKVALLAPATRAVLENAARIRSARRIQIASDAANAGQPLVLSRASAGPIPGRQNGLFTALCIGAFIAFFSIGPGVCVWLALSELMPTRIRSVGMGMALLINQGVGTIIAAAFLPIVGNYGFYAMFLFWAGSTVIYFVTAAFFLPETKGKTLEQIEGFFTRRREAAPLA
jgi:hypothetical protein